MSATAWWTICGLFLTATGGIISLLKEKPDQDPQHERRRKRIRHALLALMAAGLVLGIYQAYRADAKTRASENKHTQERLEDKQRIAGLNQSIETQIKNNETQYLRHQQELQRVQDQLSDLKKDVATQDLRKKLTTLQGQLEKELTPTPKAKLDVSLVLNASMRFSVPVKVGQFPADGNLVHVNFTVMNNSAVNATNVMFWIRVPENCRFHSEPQHFEHAAGAPEFERLLRFGDLGAGVNMEMIKLEIEVPSGLDDFDFGGKYRCDTCDIEDWQTLRVLVQRH